MLYKLLLLLHICSAIVGLLSGFMAVAFRKGSSWHAAAGTVFFVAMLSMAGSAGYMAAFLGPNTLNVTVSLLTLYLVLTGRRAARRLEGGTTLFDRGALLYVIAVGVLGLAFGFQAAGLRAGERGGPPAAYFAFGSIALLLAIGDVRMLVRGGAVGARRIGRHLWRMSLTLLIATLSFYPGQARIFPKPIRATNLLYVPHVLLLGVILIWLYRISVRKRAERKRVNAAKRDEPAAPKLVAVAGRV